MATISPARVCPGMQGAPRNAWYVAAFSREVTRAVFHRELLGDHVVFYRTEDGTAVALADRCPHRGLPLSQGKLVGDAIQCGYHGFVFGQTGSCVSVPSQSTVPSSLAVRKYPLVEKWEWIWIWMGDPEKANPDLIPDHYEMGLGREGYDCQPLFMMEIQANFQLLHENLLDTTHITYLHPGEFDSGDASTSDYVTSFDGGVIRVMRDIPNDRSPLSLVAREAFNGPADRRLVTETFVPGLNVIRNLFYDPARPGRAPEEVSSPFGITPKNDHACYHFIVVTGTLPSDWNPEVVQHLWDVFDQDRRALEAIQQGFDKLGEDAPEFSVRADQAALRCRRAIADMVHRENAA